jgi:hypothetical protein
MDIITEFETTDVAVAIAPNGTAVLTFRDPHKGAVAVHIRRRALESLADRVNKALESVPSPSRSQSKSK